MKIKSAAEDLKEAMDKAAVVWDGKGRPPKVYSERIKESKLQRKRLRVPKGGRNKGREIIVPPGKIELFFQEWLKNDGNATQAALVVFKCTTIKSAAEMGRQYLQKAKEAGLMRTLIEKKGYHEGKLIDIAIQKMLEDKTPAWWDRVMKMAGYEDFITKKEAKQGPTVVNIVSAQKQVGSKFGFGEEVVDAEEE